jgi:putative transposase
MHANPNRIAPAVAQVIAGVGGLPHHPAASPSFLPPVTGASLPPGAPVTWLTAAALAGAGLPGLPTSAFRLRERARRERWTARRAHRRGGGLEYAVAAMPPAVQLELARRAQASGVLRLLPDPLPAMPVDVGRAARGAAGQGGALDVALMPAWARTRALARGEVLAHLREYRRHAGASNAAVDDFAHGYNASRIEVSAATRAVLPRVSAPSLIRWRRLHERRGLTALAGRYGTRRGWGHLDRDLAMREVALAMLAQFGAQLRLPRIREALRARFPERPTPSIGAIGRFIRRWRATNPSLTLALHDPDRWKGAHRMKLADAGAAVTGLNQEWQIDGTPGDVLVLDHTGSTRRWHILALIDVYSRRAMFHVAPSESASAAVRLIVRALLAWGVPATIHGDNGAGFVSNHARRFLDDLGIRYVASPPFRPETKPFVESVIKTMSHQLLALLPGYAGHNVAERQALRARTSFAARFGAPAQKIFAVKLTPAELQRKLDVWAEHLYGNRPHAGIAGKAPNQAAAEWAGEVRHIANERALAIIAEEAVARRIGRDGVRIAGARFVPTSSSINEYVGHVGETALCFPDPAGDLGRYLLFLETPRGREFIATVENSGRRGHDRGELALRARQAQDQFIRTGRAGLRRLRKLIKPETLADAILNHATSECLSLTGPALEQRSDEGERATESSGGALAEAERAGESASCVKNLEDGICHQSDEPVAPMLAGVGHPGGTIAADWQRYCALRAAPCLTVENRAWMARYETTREYRVACEFEYENDRAGGTEQGAGESASRGQNKDPIPRRSKSHE